MRRNRKLKYAAFVLLATTIVTLSFVLPAFIIRAQDRQFLDVARTDTRITQSYQYKINQYDVVSLLYKMLGRKFELAAGYINEEDFYFEPEMKYVQYTDETTKKKMEGIFENEIQSLQQLSVLPAFDFGDGYMDVSLYLISAEQIKMNFWIIMLDTTAKTANDEYRMFLTLMMDEQYKKVYSVEIYYDKMPKLDIDEMADGFARYQNFENAEFVQAYTIDENVQVNLSQYRTGTGDYDVIVEQNNESLRMYLKPPVMLTS